MERALINLEEFTNLYLFYINFFTNLCLFYIKYFICIFNSHFSIGGPQEHPLYADYIMRNAGLDEALAGIKIAGRNINNLNTQMTLPLWQKVKTN